VQTKKNNNPFWLHDAVNYMRKIKCLGPRSPMTMEQYQRGNFIKKVKKYNHNQEKYGDNIFPSHSFIN
jgi:hypothetical protein